MFVVDASCLIEVLTGGPGAEAVRQRLGVDPDHASPHIIDVEALDAVLLTTDRRLAAANGPSCRIGTLEPR